MLWLMAAIFLITVLLLVLLKRDASRIDDYFCNAVTVHTLTGDEGARIAALIAGKLAAGSRRGSMLLYLRGIASDIPTGADFDIVRSRLVELADETRGERLGQG